MERKKKKLTGSTAAKITAFFLMAMAFVIGSVSISGCVVLYGDGIQTKTELQESLMWEEYFKDRNLVEQFLFTEPDEEFLTELFSQRNSSVEVYVEEKEIFNCYDGKETPFQYTESGTVPGELVKTKKGTYELDTDKEDSEVSYTIRLYVDPDFPVEDAYKTKAETIGILYDMQTVFPIAVVCSVLILFLCFIFLMCGAGHKNGVEGIVPSVISEFAFDFVTIAFGFVAVLGVVLFNFFYRETFAVMAIAFLLIGMLEVVWCTMYCVEFATRLKMGKFWTNTLVYIVLRSMWRAIKWTFRSLVSLIRGIPLVHKTVIAFLGLSFFEMVVCLLIGWTTPLMFVWMSEKIFLFPVIIYFALVCKKLQQGSEALSEGKLDYHVDTSRMLLDFKEHGENLNRMGQGISSAVEERMRSERLKTELITNVSHDLKTPLTSIINYADLLGSENLEKEKVSEYAEVLLRQSKRLKKLLEDLVEASKATTGNLEVNSVPCEVGVMLSQAAGEYEQRFAERGLMLITKQPEESIRILADGRHLWRTFDNLMNNIYKYAQESTRVYLSVEKKGDFVEIIFRNMSKYVLDVTGEELQERFVRGDKSRHMEGNGLGLSIAKSLTELQNGSLEIVTDGDLFKVVLRFPVLEENE